MTDSLVSIIVPVYNAREYLDDCIVSIINQTYSNIEIILIDDGSTDKSAAICDEYAKADKRVHVIHKENGGVSSARNAGLEYASGEFIDFCDSDDKMSENMIELLLDGIMKTDSDIACCDMSQNKDDIHEQPNAETGISVYGEQDAYTAVCGNNKIAGYIGNKLFRAEPIKNNSIIFDKNIHSCEDLVFVLTAFLNGTRKKLCYIDRKLYYYRDNLSSLSNQQLTYKRATSVLGLEKSIEVLEKSRCDRNLIVKMYERMMISCCRYYCQVLLSRINRKKECLEMLKGIYIRNCGKYNMPKNVNFKIKCYFRLMKIVTAKSIKQHERH